MTDQENGIVPIDIKEFEPAEMITVQRTRVMSANVLGRPVVNILNNKSFKNLKEAFKWTCSSPEYSYYYEITLPNFEFSAKMGGRQRGNDETLIVTSKGKVGISPRSKDDHHGVSTDYSSFFNIVINLEHNQNTLFDRGLAWINLDINDSKAKPKLTFMINAGIHTDEELTVGIIQMLYRVDSVTKDLLNGIPLKEKDLLDELIRDGDHL